MKFTVYLLLPAFLMLLSSDVFSQDKIYLKNGENINVKILEVNLDDLKYKKFSNQEGPLYTIIKSDIHMVIYENGETDIFKSTNSNYIGSSSLEKTKSIIIQIINNYGSSLHGRNPFQASFEGEYLRIRETNRNQTSVIYDLGAFDFSNVYKFDGVSYRSTGRAYVNIWVLNKRKQYWKKEKLVIGISDHYNAKKLDDALMEYSRLIKK